MTAKQDDDALSRKPGELQMGMRGVVRRLARIAGRELLTRRGWWLLALACAVAIARPWLFPLPADWPLYLGAPIALAAALSVLVAGSLVLAWWGRRRRPNAITAARAVDEALGLEDVVASGVAFEIADRSGPFEELARVHAGAALAELSPEEAFPLPRLVPRFRVFWRATVCLLVVALIGSYDPVLLSVLIHPPTDGELAAAAELDEAAQQLAHHDKRDPAASEPSEQGREADAKREEGADASDRELQKRARDIAEAVARGDRKRALSDLSELREMARSRQAEADKTRAALDDIASALAPREGEDAEARDPAQAGEGAKGEQGDKGEEGDKGDKGDKGADSERAKRDMGKRGPRRSAAEEASLLSKKLRKKGKSGEMSEEERKRTLERLERASREAKTNGHDELSKSLDKAAESLSGESPSAAEREKAAKALERAAEQMRALEMKRIARAKRAKSAGKLLEKAGNLERALQLGMTGRDGDGSLAGKDGKGGKEGGGDGEDAGEGDGMRGALARRLEALGLRDGGGGPGDGGHVADRGDARRKPMTPGGSEHAPSMVDEGGRAVAALRGMGAAGEPTEEYRDVYPSYGAIAEEALADESIPAARRSVVRRYFERIRPGGEDDRGKR